MRVRLPQFLIILLPVWLLGCSSQGDTPLSSPTTLSSFAAVSALTVCGVEITSFNLDTDLSGPYVVVSVGFAGSPASLQFEMERYLAGGGTDPVGSASSSNGQARIGAAFSTKYRVRARGSCGETSDWMDIQIGPANVCGTCGPASPPPPQPSPPSSPPPSTPRDDDKCTSKDGDDHNKDRDKDGHRRDFGGAGGHDKCRD